MKGFMSTLQSKLAELTNDVAIASAAALDILQYNSSTGKWVNRQPFGTETNTSPVAGGNDTLTGSTNRWYSFFTLPATAPYFIPTGIEWKNGTAVAGNMLAGIDQVDANPPTLVNTNTLIWSPVVAQAGTSAVQRISRLTPTLIPAGTICGAWIVSSSGATAKIGTTTVGSSNNLRAIGQAAPATTHQTAWTAGTEEAYIKVYYKPVMGV